MFSRYWNNFSFILLSIFQDYDFYCHLALASQESNSRYSQAEGKAEEEAGENLEIAFNPFDTNVYFDA